MVRYPFQSLGYRTCRCADGWGVFARGNDAKAPWVSVAQTQFLGFVPTGINSGRLTAADR
jgi:hypothetical protein